MRDFSLITDFSPKGDQPRAIAELVGGLKQGKPHQVLLGVTGSGKTFTIANVITAVQRPALVIAHNKTLAAQLYGEFKELFPENAVEYFVSYYDYYRPEAYLPTTDTYIEKESTINENIEKLRHSATRSLFERQDVIVVASVSCIYGLGSPEAYGGMLVMLEVGTEVGRDVFLRRLVEILYERNDYDFHRGSFRVRGDVVDVFPAYEDEQAVRVEFFGDTVEKISLFDPLRGKKMQHLERIAIYPGSHYVTFKERLPQAIAAIREELRERLTNLEAEGKLLEAQRLKQRTLFDLEMIAEMGYCQGIENYSRHLTGRIAGEPPPTLMEYLPKNALVIIDESHATMPQIRGMYRGDFARKSNLVNYGFRLPSALDNRPLTFDEFEQFKHQRIYISATPAAYEVVQAEHTVVEQVIRPTGLLDPDIIVRPVGGQIEDLLGEIKRNVAMGERTLVTSLTKRMAENVAAYYEQQGIKAKYLHSDIDTLERVRIIHDLRKGEFDVLIGVNLLREGLDLPEVSLVAILDADKEGFLRSERSLMQTAGRAARNINGRVIMYADNINISIAACITETNRRRALQYESNQQNGITPTSIKKAINEVLCYLYEADHSVITSKGEHATDINAEELQELITRLNKEMKAAAKELRFEEAAAMRDQIKEYTAIFLKIEE
ncbi:MAG: excinuclease ABC subunit UvrB [Deltaproteobacteria bacterium]|nr:excinuclease ABC subunit UvrB [Deltaproteobacteria bacterium]